MFNKICALLALTVSFSNASAKPEAEMAFIKGGAFTPFYAKDIDGKSISIVVKDFYIDKTPVTNADYLSFVKKNPSWSKSKVKTIFAESSYLKHWSGDKSFKKDHEKKPVRFVSWFAASAYCESLDKDLPTIVQWEYAASADEKSKFALNKKAHQEKILKWYSRPSIDKLHDVKSSEKNYWGVYDLHGLVWEWNLDYNTALVTGESREDESLDKNKFCGSGALGAKDKLDYGAFMRFGFRSSLKGNYTIGNLGFRCAKIIKKIK